MKFDYGKFSYEYNLIRQNRKTLSLTVDPSLRIFLKVPLEVTEEEVDAFLKRKWFWLERQIGEFKKYKKKKYDKEYVSGESFYFLGKQYKLSIKKSNSNHIDLKKRDMIASSTLGAVSSKHIRILIRAWYQEQRKYVFNQRLEKLVKEFDGIDKPSLIIRDMEKRWGSFINDSKIILNPKLIYASVDCIDYVITHELCHFKYKNHNIGFYKLLNKKFPKWEKTKEKLELMNI